VLVDDRIAIATPEGVDVELVLAGLGSRFLARLLDTFIQAACILALSVVALIAHDSAGGWSYAFAIIGIFVVMFVYDIVFEVLASGRTPGKRAAGIRVVGLRGQPVNFRASAVRNVVRLVDLSFLYLPGVVAILTTSRDQRLGDLAAGTIVVRERFGGRRASLAVPPALTVPAVAVAGWDVSTISGDDVAVVRRFLDRRLELPWNIRAHLAGELVHRLAPRITGLPTNAHPEYVLEGIVVAKHARA
jgi:uncharacterized RDD family membrane protein YckC